MDTKVAVSNATIVRNMLDAFRQGDIPYILKQLSDDCDWNIMGAPLLPPSGRYIGKGAGLFFTKLNEEFELVNFEVQNIYEVSETAVISTGFMSMRSRKTAQVAQSPWMMHTKVQNGKVVYFQDYIDTAKFVQALQPQLK